MTSAHLAHLRIPFLLGLLAISTGAYAAKYQEIDVTDGGTIKGKLTFEGELPDNAIEKIGINKNPDICDVDGTGYREVVWIDVENGALRGAFVFIDGVTEGKKWPDAADKKYIVLQKGCRFRPWAQVVRPGPLTIRHDDGPTVLHNINTREMIGVEKGRVVKRTLFNFGQPEPGDIETQLKPRRSPFIAMNCESHNFMFGFMMAPTHPYAVVVEEDGSYVIDDLPPGSYTVKAWHPTLGIQKTTITVSQNEVVETNFSFSR